MNTLPVSVKLLPDSRLRERNGLYLAIPAVEGEEREKEKRGKGEEEGEGRGGRGEGEGRRGGVRVRRKWHM